VRARSLAAKKPTRIQAKNRAIIERAALEIFSRDGFRGTTVDAIAEAAGMSKPNLLYYFPTKDAIYRTLLEGLLQNWLAPLADLDPSGEPADQIAAYITRKIELAQGFPMESRLFANVFANEMIRGAPILQDMLAGELKLLVDEKATVIKGWMQEGRLTPVDPHHLIFAIWATTQHSLRRLRHPSPHHPRRQQRQPLQWRGHGVDVDFSERPKASVSGVATSLGLNRLRRTRLDVQGYTEICRDGFGGFSC